MTDTTLLDLPEPLLALTASFLPLDGVGRARRICRALLHAVASDPELVWGRLVEEWRWRLRRRDDETSEVIVRRGHVGQRQQRLFAVGGCNTTDMPLRSIESVEIGKPLLADGGEGTSSWVFGASLELGRDAPAVTCDGNRLIVLGGWDGRDPLTSCVEVEATRVQRRHDFHEAAREMHLEYDESGSSSDSGSDAPDDEVPVLHSWMARKTEVRASAWRPLPPLPVGSCFGGAHADGKRQLWAVGGGDSLLRGARCFAAISVLPCDAQQQQQQQQRQQTGVAASSGDAAVVGGWRTAGQLRRPRCGLALACDARRDTLYVCGGYSGGLEYEPTVETFDTVSGRGAMLPLMASERSGCGAAFGPCGALYVVGGSQDGGRAVVSSERYDPREGRWRPIAPLDSPRAYLGATFALDGSLIVAGGNGFLQQLLASTQIYDPRADAWRAGPSLRRKRANLGLVLMAG